MSWLDDFAGLTRDEQEEILRTATEEEKSFLDAEIMQADPSIWIPQPGPQTEAYNSPADELFYGGAQGGGKSDLILGLAGTRHHHSIIFRRTFPLHRSLIERSRVIYNAMGDAHHRDRYNESLHRWALPGGRLIEFGAIEHEQDKENFRGRPHSLYAWDEICQFTESQFRFVNAWNRSTIPGERCRVVATGNPPSTVEGEWVIRYWGPWLDEKHKNPAVPGELRWFARIENEDVELKDGEPFEYKTKGGRTERIQPRSRTFIPALLCDNPILEKTGYLNVIQSLPEPLRTQALYGSFSVGLQDNAWQVIPTEWVRAAQKRWRAEDGMGRKLDCIGVDVAYGGGARTCLAKRYGNWFAPILQFPGSETATGEATAALIVKELTPGAAVHIDAIGYGAAAYEALKRYEWIAKSCAIIPVNSEYPIGVYDRSRRFKLVNVRAACWWRMREALDPENGDDLALPDDRDVIAELCAPRYELTPSGIKIEKKDKIIERIGRSTDVADSICLAVWYTGGHPTTPPAELIDHLTREFEKNKAKREPAWMSEEDEEDKANARTANQNRRGMFGR